VLVSLGLLACNSQTAWAARYEVFVEAESEEDLFELLATDQISQPSFDALLSLLQTRVNLNQADRERLYLLPNIDYADVDRIISHRDDIHWIQDLSDLVETGALTAEVARSLRPFIVIDSGGDPRSGAEAMVRLQGRWSGRYDRLPPPLAAQARIRALARLDIGGAATLTRNQLSRARWDTNRRALTTGPERARFEVPKLYVHWQDTAWEIIAGTYRIGFGQRLTFDVTDQVTPNGFFGDYQLRRENTLTRRCKRTAGELAVTPCNDDVISYVTPDFAWTNRLTGVALGLKHRTAGNGWMELYAWGSYQIHRALQIEVVIATDCDDPRTDEDPACAAPPIFVPTDGATGPASAARFAQLRWAYAEGLAGARVRYSWSARKHVGLTGFGSVPRWLVLGAALDFQEFAAKPFGGPFGAVGLDAGFGFGRQDCSLELARSFDSQQGGGGGFGAVARSVTTLGATELDISARYYAARYANPYARSISAPDELDGLRARDEAGIRLRMTTRVGGLGTLRSVVDGWRRLSSGAMHAALFVRADLRLAPAWSWALWANYHHGPGGRLAWSTKVGYEPHPRWKISGQFQHRLIADRFAGRRRQHDLGTLATLVARPVDALRLQARVRYDLEDISDDEPSVRALWAKLEIAVVLRDRDTLRLRYDARALLDDRASTAIRRPNPEHWLLVEYVWRH
jgi:hypothetical protein